MKALIVFLLITQFLLMVLCFTIITTTRKPSTVVFCIVNIAINLMAGFVNVTLLSRL